MATLDPTLEGFYTQWAHSGVGNKLDGQKDSNDATLINEGVVNEKQSFELDTATEAIGQVQSRVRAKWQGAACKMKLYSRLGGADGAQDAEITLTNAWVWYLSSPLARPGGGQWSLADITGSTFELCVEATVIGGGGFAYIAEWECITTPPVGIGLFSVISGILVPTLTVGGALWQS